jgi:hypothetical protein
MVIERGFFNRFAVYPDQGPEQDNQCQLDTGNTLVNTLSMELKRIAVDGITRYARSFYILLGNRRKFERVPFSGTIFVTCKGFVVDTTHVCSFVDISPRGIGVECPEPLTVDEFVEVHADDHGPRRRARVCYCLQRGERHRVGLEFVARPQ